MLGDSLLNRPDAQEQGAGKPLTRGANVGV